MDTDEPVASDLSGFTLFDFELVPQAWYARQEQPITLQKDGDGQAVKGWWDHISPEFPFADHFDGFMSRSDPFLQLRDPYETAWTDDNHHTVGLWRTEVVDIVSVVICLDIRYPYSDFLHKLVNIARRSDCLFYMCYEGSFLEPSNVKFVEAVNRSPAGMAIANPASVLRIH